MTQTATETNLQSDLVPAFDTELQSPLWDGSWLKLEQNRSVNMPQTSNFAMTVVAFTYTRDMGSVRLVSGGHTPKTLEVNGNMNAPVPHLHNYRGDNLQVTNTSATNVPIWIGAYRPGTGNPLVLPNDGTPVLLTPFRSSQGNAKASFQELVLSSPGNYSVFTVLYGGKAFIYALNAPEEVPEGYTDTTPGNTLRIGHNFMGAEIYVGNLSPYKSGEGTVRLV